MNAELLQRLREIGKRLHEQDNRCTDAPIFIVQQKRRLYGLDPSYSDGSIVWIDSANDYAEATPEEHEYLEKSHQDGKTVDDNWTRTAFQDQWEFVAACFTEAGAQEYLRANGHNLKETRIYAESSYRNEEFRVIREFIMSLE